MQNKLSFILLGAGAVVVAGGLWLLLSQQPEERQTTNGDMLTSEDEIKISTQRVEYFEGVRGYYAAPKNDKEYPGVVMIHEWWGLNDNITHMAEQLADEGYRVLAVDLYNGQIAETSEEARQLTGSLDQQQALANLRAAAAYLRSQNASKVASLGWCFGGGQSMQFALSGEELDATVIYYGDLVTEEERLAAVDWPVLGVFGEEDQSISQESVRSFEESLNSVGVDNEIYMYPGVGHAFANPSGDNYAAEATRDAWQKTLAFLNRTLK